MLARQRYHEILNRLNAQGTVRTIELAAELQVTDETIRRDLQSLAEEGLVERVHGGAMMKGERPRSLAFTERQAMNMDAKRAIARASIDLIAEGDIVAFDSSTTVAELIALLPDFKLRVVTNAHNVITGLHDKKNVELVCIGGSYDPRTRTFHSLDNLLDLRRYNVNKFFISANGLDLRRGASETYRDQALYKETLMQTCEQVHLLVDHSKLGKRADFFFADMNHITSVITDNQADTRFLDSLRSAGIEVRIGTVA